jgi:hypothetical protein
MNLKISVRKRTWPNLRYCPNTYNFGFRGWAASNAESFPTFRQIFAVAVIRVDVYCVETLPWRWQQQCLPKRKLFNTRRVSSPKAEVVQPRKPRDKYYCPNSCPEGLRKTTKKLIHDMRPPGQDLNQGLQNTKQEYQPLGRDVRCSIIILKFCSVDFAIQGRYSSVKSGLLYTGGKPLPVVKCCVSLMGSVVT